MAFVSNLKSLTPRKLQYKKNIKLLSHGYTSPGSFPDGEITVYPWDTKVDDWLGERMKKGRQDTVLYDLCAQLCDLNGCSIDNFVVGDVNTVLLVSRSIRFNSIIEYQATCPACAHASVETIAVPDELGKIGEKDSSYPGFDEIILPESKDLVKIRPLLVRDEKHILERDATSREAISDHAAHMLYPIVSINDGRPDNLNEVSTWFDAISPKDVAFLEQQENQLYPHLDTDIPHVCDRCQTQFSHTLDFSKDFFRASLKPGKGATLQKDVRPGSEQSKPDVSIERHTGSVSGAAPGAEQREGGAT
jgi:hypothetical protein